MRPGGVKGLGMGLRPRRGRGCSLPGGRESTRREASHGEDAGRGLSGFSTHLDALAKLNLGSTVTPILKLSPSSSLGVGGGGMYNYNGV